MNTDTNPDATLEGDQTEEAAIESAVAVVSGVVGALATQTLKAPIDQSFTPQPRRRNQEPPSLRSGDQLMHPSISFSPENITTLHKDYPEEAATVAIAATALDTVRAGVQAVIDARMGSQNHPAWTEPMQVLQVALKAEKMQSAATAYLDRAAQQIISSIKALEAQLREPIKANASSVGASEIRRHFKESKTSDRHALMSSAIENGDSETLAAVLGGRSYLSGLTDDIQAAYLEKWRHASNPTASRRLKLLRDTRQRLDNVTLDLLTTQFERAMGCTWKTVNRVRSQETAALKQFNGT